MRVSGEGHTVLCVYVKYFAGGGAEKVFIYGRGLVGWGLYMPKGG